MGFANPWNRFSTCLARWVAEMRARQLETWFFVEFRVTPNCIAPTNGITQWIAQYDGQIVLRTTMPFYSTHPSIDHYPSLHKTRHQNP
jgi:hypothetical protein